MEWMFVPLPHLPNSYVEPLPLNMTVSGGGMFREVIRIRWRHRGGALVNEMSALLRVRRELASSSALCQGRMQPEVQSLQQGRSPHESLTMMPSWSWTSSHQNCEKKNFLQATQFMIFWYSSQNWLKQSPVTISWISEQCAKFKSGKSDRICISPWEGFDWIGL